MLPTFDALLSARGRRVLLGKDPALTGILKTGKRFVAVPGLFSPAGCRRVVEVLERNLAPHLSPMDEPIPPQTIFGMRRNYEELLPKAVRCRTALLASSRARSSQVAKAIGLSGLVGSPTFRALAEVLSGRKLRRHFGTQVLAYGPSDYAGPHTDHHPEEPEARDGYTDVHLTFCTRGVAAQTLVYEERGHLSAQASVATLGGLTAYRLPFWHYTTPLLARRGQDAHARRWVLLGTFLDARVSA
ncbi:MAG: hypothetical protein K1X89_05535 [Myxococcaceae bacterium]|nr:hypothetical protein [Myxococcaceae bacterium]